MEAAKFWNAATLAFALVLCLTYTGVTWRCVNEVARLQSRVERLEAEDKGSSVSQLLGQLGVQTLVYQGDEAEEEIPGHHREIRQNMDDLIMQIAERQLGEATEHHRVARQTLDLYPTIVQIVRDQLEAHLNCSTVEDQTKCTIEPGPKGDPGPSGPPGPQGETGDQGQKGDRGETGHQGYPGSKGDKGEVGMQGLQGGRGDRGEKGDMGTRGPVGEKGERGDTGPRGAKGYKGQLGYPGYKGQKGEPGERGVQGPIGAHGLPGPKGEKGDVLRPKGPYVCDGTTGWTRVAYLDMTNTSHQCLGDMVEVTLSGKRVCGRGISRSPSCVSATFSTNGLQYSQVCGRITGYQYGETEGFNSITDSIESYYVDGVSVTCGPPGSREHVWTLATGKSETASDGYHGACPCTPNALSGVLVPSFVGQNYFCESGRRTGDESTQLYSDDPLWDGDGCSVAGNSCCEFNNPPYFTRHLTNPTSNDLEVRACGYFGPKRYSEDTMIELIELYVK